MFNMYTVQSGIPYGALKQEYTAYQIQKDNSQEEKAKEKAGA
jgi:hypothetical protein